MVDEFKLYQETEVYNEIKELIQRILTLGEENNAVTTIIRALLLKTKLSVIEGDLVQAQELLAQAQQLAKNNDFQVLFKQVEAEKQRLETEYAQFETGTEY